MRDRAATIGYPVMIKASAGGGGKGMRVAHDDKEAREGFAPCRAEAQGELRRRPRLHREVHRGAAAHRDPGAGRRARQLRLPGRARVLDPAPPPEGDRGGAVAVPRRRDARARWASRRWRWRKAVDYQSAGTVEFVVGKDRSFYFLEMNTRLQVEHPVTEMITGLDLVEQMIRVAAGEKLPFAQADIKRDGWAIECRINAEDPLRDFLPSIGRLVRYRPPRARCRARRARRHRRLRGRRDLDVLRLDDRQARSCTARPRRGDRDDARRAERVRDPRRRVQHRVPVGAGAASALRRRAASRPASSPRSIRRASTASDVPPDNPAFLAAVGARRASRVPRPRGRHRRPGAGPRASTIGDDFVVLLAGRRRVRRARAIAVPGGCDVRDRRARRTRSATRGASATS